MGGGGKEEGFSYPSLLCLDKFYFCSCSCGVSQVLIFPHSYKIKSSHGRPAYESRGVW